MDEKEKQIQQALGTRERQKFVSADFKDTDALVTDFREAIEHFGLFMYEDPEMEGGDMYMFVISDEELTQKQLEILCDTEYIEEEEEENETST